jgi:phage terminase large subunit-like protein
MTTNLQLSSMPPEQLDAFIKRAEKTLERRRAENRLASYYPDTGPLRRALYPKHMMFFEAGKTHRERAAIAANRVGKTEGLGGYEVTLHLIGEYPQWWPGRKWDRPVNVLCGGDKGTTTRDIMVRKLLGPPTARGTGLIPKRCIEDIIPYAGIRDHVDVAHIKTAHGGFSSLQFRSYEQGREAWQGTERDIVWLDEEPPEDIYVEALMRTMTTGGMVMGTFTPLSGMTKVVLSFMPHLAPAA